MPRNRPKSLPSTTPKSSVFVLMPFDKSFDDVYKLGINSACKEAGAYCERVDEQIFTESILERIYNQIARADLIVSDMTGRNPNVFYETGYAHALGKLAILLTQKSEDIPFDLKHYPHIIYGSVAELKSQLKKRISYFMKYPDKKQLVTPEMLQYQVNGKIISTLSNVTLAHEAHDKISGWRLSFDIHNPGEKMLDLSEMSFGLVFPSSLGEPVAWHEDFIKIDESNYMYLSSNFLHFRLLPKSWIHKSIVIHNKDIAKLAGTMAGMHVVAPQAYHCALRIFGELGMREIPFVIWTQPSAT
jgi:hypothetical protein